MSPAPTDPVPDFVPGTTAKANDVDARFKVLYDTLQPSQVGIDDGNIAAAGLSAASLSTALAEALGANEVGIVRRGKSIIATEEARTNTAFGLLATPDRVENVVLPADGLIRVRYAALWKWATQLPAAAIFLGANQMQARAATSGTPGLALRGVQEARLSETPTNIYAPLLSCPFGLVGVDHNTAAPSDVTTGQALGASPGGDGPFGPNGTVDDGQHTVGGFAVAVYGGAPVGGAVDIFAAAGTYTVSVQFRSPTAGGTVTVKERKLWVETVGFG